jgi:hypothetical protein
VGILLIGHVVDSRHQDAWARGEIRDKKGPGGGRGENSDDDTENSCDEEDKTRHKSPKRKTNPNSPPRGGGAIVRCAGGRECWTPGSPYEE